MVRNGRIILECTKCCTQVERADIDPYTGHMYDASVVYVCTGCRGDMKDVTHLVGAVCECDKALREIEHCGSTKK